MECELGEVQRTSRGFQYVGFLDRRQTLCNLQQSSAINEGYADAIDKPGSSYVWLGVTGPAGEETQRMHLSRIDVAALIEVLGRWLDRGTFVYDDKEAD